MSHQGEGRSRYWFPAKRYGLGWGLPCAWQGWLTLLLYIAAIVLIAFRFPPDGSSAVFLFSVMALSLLLIMVCWLKGEPPRWRWGKD